MANTQSCGNRSPISGECVLGCGGFGGCKRGYEDHIKPRGDQVSPLTGKLYPDATKIERPVEYVSQLPDGAGPVTACTMFNGMLLAATDNGMYQLVGSEWRRMEFATTGEEQPS